MNAKPVSASRTMMTDLVLSSDANVYGTIFGGKVMAYVDKIASITAMRHCRMPVVTASTDSFNFLAPIHVGEAISVEAFVAWTHNTSMEIFCRIECEDLMTGQRKETGTSYLTFVALGSDGKPALVPPVEPETDEEKWHFETASLRRKQRLAARQDHRQQRQTRQSET